MSVDFKPLEARAMKWDVVDRLREGIMAGKFKPGDPLRETRLAKKLGVSQTVIREALLHLEHVGLVMRTPNVGTRVTRFSEEEVRQRLAVRRHLEEMALREAAPRMTEADFEKLQKLLHELAGQEQTGDHFELTQADLRFHSYIWTCADNEVLKQTLEQIAAPLFAFASLLRRTNENYPLDIVARHQPIIDALRARDEAAMRAALEGHAPPLSHFPPP